MKTDIHKQHWKHQNTNKIRQILIYMCPVGIQNVYVIASPTSKMYLICCFLLLFQDRSEWYNGLMGMEDALVLERYVNAELLKLHKNTDDDAHVSNTLKFKNSFSRFEIFLRII